MTSALDNCDTITDFITGQTLPDVGAELNRQRIEKWLVKQNGFLREDVCVNYPLVVTIGEDRYRSHVDLVIEIESRRVMVIKCAAGSLGSRQREILATARLLGSYQVPLSVVSDGDSAIVLDTISGKEIGVGLHAIPNRRAMVAFIAKTDFIPYPEKRREREAIIFRSYDAMNVNVARVEESDI